MKEVSPLRSRVIELADWIEKEIKSGKPVGHFPYLNPYELIKVQRNIRRELRKRGVMCKILRNGIGLMFKV